MSKKNYMPALIGGAIGAIAISIMSFSMDWVVTTGRAHADTLEASSEAVKAQLAPICEHQFNAQADSAVTLGELRALQSWKREAFIRDGGWATMPGSENVVTGVARLCAERLVDSAS